MTEDLFPEQAFKLFAPENVVPAALFLVSEDAPTNAIVGAGGGGYHSAWVMMNDAVWLPEADRTVEGFAAQLGGDHRPRPISARPTRAPSSRARSSRRCRKSWATPRRSLPGAELGQFDQFARQLLARAPSGSLTSLQDEREGPAPVCYQGLAGAGGPSKNGVERGH